MMEKAETARPRRYQTGLVAVENDKGVLDLDTVKGCSAGMKAHEGGCYGACYAAKIAKFRGLDFTTSVGRYPRTPGEVKALVRSVTSSSAPFVRIGTMGDPSLDWPATVRTAALVARYKPVVIVTKWWGVPSDGELARLVGAGVTVNTSVSALDTDAELAHRLKWHDRYREEGGNAVLRIVTVDALDPVLRERQDDLMARERFIDNPLRVPGTHPLVTGGLIRIRRVRDLNAEVSVSLWDEGAYIGRCSECPDQCGIEWKEA